MHHGARADYCKIVRDHLHAVYPNHCIGRGEPQQWPARFPDLNTLDFVLWGHLKTGV